MATVKQATAGAQWVTSWIYGMDSFPNDKNLLDLIKAVFICAAGDGEVSKTERDFFFGYLDAVGMSVSMISFAQPLGFDPCAEHRPFHFLFPIFTFDILLIST
jgi:hypothetical protein